MFTRRNEGRPFCRESRPPRRWGSALRRKATNRAKSLTPIRSGARPCICGGVVPVPNGRSASLIRDASVCRTNGSWRPGPPSCRTAAPFVSERPQRVLRTPGQARGDDDALGVEHGAHVRRLRQAGEAGVELRRGEVVRAVRGGVDRAADGRLVGGGDDRVALDTERGALRAAVEGRALVRAGLREASGEGPERVGVLGDHRQLRALRARVEDGDDGLVAEQRRDVVRAQRAARHARHERAEDEARGGRPGVDADERRRVPRGVGQRLGARVALGRRGLLVLASTASDEHA